MNLAEVSDAELGKTVRSLMEKIQDHRIQGYEKVATMSALFVLTGILQGTGIGTAVFNLNDTSSEMYPTPTDWRITVEKIE